VDERHSNIRAAWEAMGGGDWPDAAQWERLHAADRLELLEPEREVVVADGGGSLTLEFALPMPSISLVELVPAGR